MSVESVAISWWHRHEMILNLILNVFSRFAMSDQRHADNAFACSFVDNVCSFRQSLFSTLNDDKTTKTRISCHVLRCIRFKNIYRNLFLREYDKHEFQAQFLHWTNSPGKVNSVIEIWWYWIFWIPLLEIISTRDCFALHLDTVITNEWMSCNHFFSFVFWLFYW